MENNISSTGNTLCILPPTNVPLLDCLTMRRHCPHTNHHTSHTKKAVEQQAIIPTYWWAQECWCSWYQLQDTRTTPLVKQREFMKTGKPCIAPSARGLQTDFSNPSWANRNRQVRDRSPFITCPARHADSKSLKSKCSSSWLLLRGWKFTDRPCHTTAILSMSKKNSGFDKVPLERDSVPAVGFIPLSFYPQPANLCRTSDTLPIGIISNAWGQIYEAKLCKWKNKVDHFQRRLLWLQLLYTCSLTKNRSWHNFRSVLPIHCPKELLQFANST